MTIATTTVRLASAVPAGGSFLAPYPVGHSAGTVYLFGSHVIVDAGGAVYSGVKVSNSGAGITVTNSTGRELRSGELLTIQLTGYTQSRVGGGIFDPTSLQFVGVEDPAQREQLVRAPDAVHPGALVTDWGSAGSLSTTGSTGTGFAFALDTTVLCNGKPAVKCTFQSDVGAQTFTGIWTPTNPIRLRDVQAIQVPIMFTSTNGSAIDYTSLRVWIQTSDFKSIRMSMNGLTTGHRAGVFQTISFSRASTSIATNTMDSLDAAGVTITSVRVVALTTGDASAFPVWFGEIRADCSRKPGRVVITMDGEYSSQYSLIYPRMRELGLVGSIAITNTDIGAAGRMSAAQISEMYASGWECIHHTFDATKTNGYVNSTDWTSSSAIAEDIRAQWAYFRTQGWTRGIGYGVWGFAYAFTSSQTQARQNLVRDGMIAGGLVGVRKSVPYAGEIANVLMPMSRMPVDPLVITGGIQVTNTDTADSIISVIDAAEARGELAIITLHRAVADSATPGSLEIRIGDLTRALVYLREKVLGGTVVVEPFGRTCSQVYPGLLSL
jgi:hypothetical protein